MYILRDRCLFGINKVNFTVPENYSIDTKETDLGDDIICFLSPDESFTVSYKLVHTNQDTKQALSDSQMGLFDECQPIEEIEHNGMKGYSTTYGDDTEQYIDARFIIGKTDSESTEFEFSILTYHGDIERIKMSPEFRELFDSIWIKGARKYKINKNS